MKKNSTINVILELKITLNCKLKNLNEEDIGSENPKNLEKCCLKKNLMKCFSL